MYYNHSRSIENCVGHYLFYVNILYVSENIAIYDDGFFERFLPPNRVPFSIIINFNNSASVW